MLDFGHPVLLTDIFIPACGDLASLSVDVWTKSEEVDGRRLAVALDIGSRDLVMNDLLPPATCRFLKVSLASVCLIVCLLVNTCFRQAYRVTPNQILKEVHEKFTI